MGLQDPADGQMRDDLLYALKKVADQLGRPEIGQLRDILRVLVDPYNSKSIEFMEMVRDERRQK